MKRYLFGKGVNVSASTANAGSMVDYQARGIGSLVRASLRYYNTGAEIERMEELLRNMD